MVITGYFGILFQCTACLIFVSQMRNFFAEQEGAKVVAVC